MKEKFYIRIMHTDSTFSWLNAGFKIALTKAKAEAMVNILRRQPQFKDAKFDLIPT